MSVPWPSGSSSQLKATLYREEHDDSNVQEDGNVTRHHNEQDDGNIMQYGDDHASSSLLYDGEHVLEDQADGTPYTDIQHCNGAGVRDDLDFQGQQYGQ